MTTKTETETPANKFERRLLAHTDRNAIKIETRDDGNPHLTGYAAVFYRDGNADTEFEIFDDLVEHCLPGCFDQTLRDDQVAGLFNHDKRDALGNTAANPPMLLRIDATGLFYDIPLPDTTVGRDLVELVGRNVVPGSSFGFFVEEQNWIERDGLTIRELVRVRLVDVGPVTFPAYKATTSDVAVRARDEWRANQPTPKLDQAKRRQRLAILKASA
jgi:uncharacterized protein